MSKSDHLIERLAEAPLSEFSAAELRSMQTHAESCADCRQALAAARLSAVLLNARATQTVSPSPFFLAGVMAQVREQQRAQQSEVKKSRAGQAWLHGLLLTRPVWGWSLAAAMALLLIAAAAFWMRPTPSERDLRAGQNPEPVPSVIQSAEKNIVPESKPELPVNEVAAVNASDTAKRRTANRRPRATVTETVTDYYPLTALAGSAMPQGGQVVRVRLPRSALSALGLPMNVERAGEQVQADVVIGDDGLAHAIRFVQ